MANLLPKRNSLPRKSKHWSNRVKETVVCRGSNGAFNLHLEGGAEHGEFIYIGDILQEKIRLKKGKVHVDEIVLEIDREPVAGYTQSDMIDFVKKAGDIITLRTVKQDSGITKDIRQFLTTRFDKGTVDNDLQQTIRENLYKRTVPCTTRTPRDGEIPGVDYTFLTLEDFRKLDQSGQLLESGIYEGNHYGTPKPPKEPLEEQKLSTKQQYNGRSSLERKRPRSYSNDRSYKDAHWEESSQLSQRKNEQDLGPLPPNWEIGYTEANEKYFIDHNTGSTQWLDPRLARVQKNLTDECNEDELPYGWEKVVDPTYGTYYIDHNTKKTQFENPVQQYKKSRSRSDNARVTHPPSFSSAAALAKAQEAEASARWPGVDFDEPPEPPAYTAERLQSRPQLFTIDGKELEGELIRTVLPKGSRGFGFTIVGGDQPGELLQIKSIVNDGAAAKDGKLKMGDALIRVNGRSVLSKTHQDVVGMFQAMPIGETVELEMIRGYPLPFDPNDPNVETLGAYTIVRAPAHSNRSSSPAPSDQSASSSVKPTNFRFASDKGFTSNHGGQLAGHSHLYPPRHHAAPNESPVGPQHSQYPSSTFPRTSTAVTLPKGAPEFITVRVVKGQMGFGFTIADSPYGQKVKQILDADRCAELREGDILIEINGQVVRSCTHNEAVNILKNCPKDREAVMFIQRGGIPTPLKNSPLAMRRDEGQENVVRRNPRPKSTPVMRYENHQTFVEPQPVQKSGSVGNMATAGESTRNQDTGSGYRQSQPRVEQSDQPSNRYPSLKKAISGSARNRNSDMQNGARSSTSSDDGVTDMDVTLKRGEMGFGFRIVGGQEEKTQVSVGTIVPGGAADKDGRLRKGDEILNIDGISIQGASHRRVISLMSNAALSGQVHLGLRRRRRSGRTTPTVSGMRRSTSTSSEILQMSNQPSQMNHASRLSSRSAGNLIDYGKDGHYEQDRDETGSVRSFHSHPGEFPAPTRAVHRDRRRSESDVAEPPGTTYRDVTLHREEREGFGFVILSSVHKSGSTIGRIIQGSPADRCHQLHVGDRLVAVNNQSIVGMHHSDIVNTIKQSGRTVTLRIALRPPAALDSEESKKLSRMSAPNIAKQTDSGLGMDSGWQDSRSASVDQLQDIDRQKDRQREELLNRHKEELRRQQQELIERQREEMRRLEHEQNRYPEEYNPPAPFSPTKKTAPPPVKPKPSKEKIRQLQGENQRPEQWNGGPQVPLTRHTEPEEQYRKPAQQNKPPPPPRHSIPVGSRDSLGRVRRLSYEGPEPRTGRKPSRDEILSKTNQMLLIELRRQSTGYGFSIRGGQELDMPIFVLRMAEGGAAAVDGRLKIGDEIMEINGHKTEGIKHTQAIELIKGGGPRVTLLIKRSSANTSFDTGIPNGGHNISYSGWDKPATGMYRPPPQQQNARDMHIYSR